MSDARRTIESAILAALADTYHIHTTTVDQAKPIVEAMIKKIFHTSTRWAVVAYVDELQITDPANLEAP